MSKVELVRHDTLLIGLYTVDGLETVLGREIACFTRGVVGPEVGEQADANCEEAEEEVDHLVVEEVGTVDASEAVDDWRAEHGAETVAGVPAGDAKGLLGAAVEGDGHEGEEGDDGGFEEAEEESTGH